MDKKELERLLQQLNSPSEMEAVSALRGLQELFAAEGSSLEEALRYAASHPEKCRKSAGGVVDHEPENKKRTNPVVNSSGVPECRVPSPGSLEIILSGSKKGEVYPLPGEAANEAELIAANLKDAIVAAVINKSRFKFKLQDLKDSKGEVLETALQAKYERNGMIPIQVWINSRGEVGALAAVLRKAVANSLPELVAD